MTNVEGELNKKMEDPVYAAKVYLAGVWTLVDDLRAENARMRKELEAMPCRCMRLDVHPHVDVICGRCKALGAP